MSLPDHGLPAETVLSELDSLRVGDLPTHGGRTWAYVYDSGLTDIDAIGARAHAAAAGLNGLDPTAFPSLLRMENDVVAATAALLGGVDTVVGSVTSGGTESCLLAVKAARDSRPDIAGPRIVIADTAHAAFHKAAEYFRVALDVVPVDSSTLQPDPDAMAAAIGPDTVLVVASAPSYAHGVIDPIADIASSAAEQGVRCHVDACIGGWVLPYFRRLGADIPPFDFSVPGVTSMSVDLHKYAYCPKGTSVLLHRDAGLRRSQYFASARWPGYTMLNATMQSTKSGGPLAAAWAVLRHVGDDGYLRLAQQTFQATRSLIERIELIDGLSVLGNPAASLIAFTSSDDVYVLADELSERGWYVQPQHSRGELPANLHLTVTAASLANVEPFCADLAESVAAARSCGPVTIDPELVAAVRALDPDRLTEEQFDGILAMAGLSAADGLPARMAEINTLLDAAPVALRERLLVEFLSRLSA